MKRIRKVLVPVVNLIMLTSIICIVWQADLKLQITLGVTLIASALFNSTKKNV